MAKKTKTNTSLLTIATFLVFELLAFAAFSLANSIILYGAIGFVLFALLFIGTSIQIKTKGFSDFAIFIIPVALYAVLLTFSSFSLVLDIATNVFVILGLFSFSAIGAYMRANKDFDLSKGLIVIYGALALLVLISYFWNMIQFEPFYTIKYANAFLYYDGAVSTSPIGEVAYFLVGFSFQKVSIEFFSLFPTILSTSVVALFFLKPKENKITFTIYAIYAFMGLLPLITMPTKTVLITDAALILLYVLIFVFTKILKNPQKIAKYCLIIGGSLIGLLFIIVFINANSSIGFIASNPLLNRIFNTNRLASSYNAILDDMFTGNKIFGFNYTHPISVPTSSSILFDNFMMAGLIGGLAFIFFICWGIYSLYLMCVKANDVSLINKSLMVGFVAAFLGYSLINYDMQPYLYYENFIPFYISGPFLIVLFIFGYSFNVQFVDNKNKEFKEHEIEQKEEEINI